MKEATVLHVLQRYPARLEAFIPDASKPDTPLLAFAERVARLLFHPDLLGPHRLTVEMGRQHPDIGERAYPAGYTRLERTTGRTLGCPRGRALLPPA